MIPSFGQLCFLLKTREVVAPPSPSEHFWGLRLIKSIFNALWRQRMSSWIQTPERGWGWHPRSSRNFSPFFLSPYKSLYCRFFKLPAGVCHTPNQPPRSISLEYCSLHRVHGFSSWIPHGASSRRPQNVLGEPQKACRGLGSSCPRNSDLI